MSNLWLNLMVFGWFVQIGEPRFWNIRISYSSYHKENKWPIGYFMLELFSCEIWYKPKTLPTDESKIELPDSLKIKQLEQGNKDLEEKHKVNTQIIDIVNDSRAHILKALELACADIERLQDIITKLKLPDFEEHELYILDDCRPNLVKHYFDKAKEK